MSVTVQNMLSLLNNYISDDTEERITNEERYYYLTEATSDVKLQMKSAMSNMTYKIKYIPGVHSYKIEQGIYNVLAAGDVRVEDSSLGKIDLPLTISSASKIDEDIKLKRYTNNYALDRYDKELYLVLSYMPAGVKKTLNAMDSVSGLTSLGDVSATEVSSVSLSGNSVKATVDVSSTVNNFAGIEKTVDLDLKDYKDRGNVVGWVKLESVTNISNIEVRVGTDSSNYYSFIATTPHNESSLNEGWNRIVIDWSDSTIVGSPDVSDINTIQTIVNYTASQTDTTIYFDDFFISNPIDLRFHYIGYAVGKNSAGDEILDFSDPTDIPYFSGQYDNLKFAVSRMAAALVFYDLRLSEEAGIQESKASQKLTEVKNMIPSNHRVEMKAFRPHGINFNRRRRR